MAIQRRRWYKNLRTIMLESPAHETLVEYEEFHRQNPPSLLYRMALFILCLFFSGRFREREIGTRLIRDMTDYAEDLELKLAHTQARVTELENNAVSQRAARERYDALRALRRAEKDFAIPSVKQKLNQN